MLFVFLSLLSLAWNDYTCCVIENLKHNEFHGVYCTNCLCEGLTGWKSRYSFTEYDCMYCGEYNMTFEPVREGAHYLEKPEAETADKLLVKGETRFRNLADEKDLTLYEPPADTCGPYKCCYYSKPEHDYLEPTICTNWRTSWKPQCDDPFEGMQPCGTWYDGTLENQCFLIYKEVLPDGSVVEHRSRP